MGMEFTQSMPDHELGNGRSKLGILPCGETFSVGFDTGCVMDERALYILLETGVEYGNAPVSTSPQWPAYYKSTTNGGDEVGKRKG